jgi:molybdopterin synthase catalytic subunit
VIARFILSAEPLDPSGLARELHAQAAGALVTFQGWVRVTTGASGAATSARARGAVTAMEYEAWGDRALRQGRQVVEAAAGSFDVLAVSCVHRVGRLAVGEIAVWIGVTAVHRDAAFGACRLVIDEVKRRVPIWKKEHFADGTSEWSGTAG